jgi:hypothetical protein
VFIPIWYNRACHIVISVKRLRSNPTLARAHADNNHTPLIQVAEIRKNNWIRIVKCLQLMVLLALLCFKLEDPGFLESYSLLFMPVWVAVVLHVLIEYRFALELASRGIVESQSPSSKALSAVTSDFEFWQCLLLVSKFNGSSSLAWEATFLPVWFLLGLGYLFGFFLSFFLVRALCFNVNRAGREVFQPAIRLFIVSCFVILMTVSITGTMFLIRISSRLDGEMVCDQATVLDNKGGLSDTDTDTELRCEFKYDVFDILLPTIVGACLVDLTLLCFCVGAYLRRHQIWQIVVAYHVRFSGNFGGQVPLEDPQISLDAMLRLPKPAMLKKMGPTYFRGLRSEDVAVAPEELLSVGQTGGESGGLPSSTPVADPNAALDAMEEGRQTIEEDDNQCCYICMSDEQNAVFMPCGHGGVCYECAINAWKKKQSAAPSCPQCRLPVSQILRLGKTVRRQDGSELVSVVGGTAEERKESNEETGPQSSMDPLSEPDILGNCSSSADPLPIPQETIETTPEKITSAEPYVTVKGG